MKLVFAFGSLYLSMVHSRVWWGTIKPEDVSMRYSDGTDTNLAAVIKGVKKI